MLTIEYLHFAFIFQPKHCKIMNYPKPTGNLGIFKSLCIIILSMISFHFSFFQSAIEGCIKIKYYFQTFLAVFTQYP